MKVVSTVKFGWSASDIAQRQMASWIAANPWLWMGLRGVWWLARKPLYVAGGALTLWLMSKGLWWPLSLAVGGVPQAAWNVRGLRRFLSFPSRGKRGFREALTDVQRWRLLKRSWTKAAINAGIMDKTDKRVPELRNAYATNTGIHADLICGAVGVPAEKVSKNAEFLATSIPGCRSVVVTPGHTPGFASLHFMWGDPLANTIGLDKLPLPPYNRLCFGLTESGDPATIAKFKSLLVVGQSGSGKSGTLWALLASALADGVPFRLRVIDPAGGVELHDFRNSPLVREYTDRPGTAKDVVSHAHQAMVRRLESMGGTTRMHKPTHAEPWEILVIDELLLMQDLLKKGADSELGEILAVGRKAAFSVWALTQLPQIDTVGRVRNLFVQKLVLATDSRAMTDSVLGDGAEANGAKCSRIHESTPGVGYAAIEGVPGYPRFRTVWVPDDVARMITQGKLPDYVPQREEALRGDLLEHQPHVLYGWYDSDGTLLYVGISNSGRRRAMEHIEDKDWAKQPGVTMQIMETFETRSAALEAEERTIKTLRPKYNIIHNG